jgi:hypothetical protein
MLLKYIDIESSKKYHKEINLKELRHFYFEKRNFNPQYDAKKPYDFKSWSDRIDKVTIRNYQSLHQDLLFSNQKQQYEEAHQVLTEINDLFQSIGE